MRPTNYFNDWGIKNAGKNVLTLRQKRRGGVYYEAGIARGLQLCNHPIKLVLTCKRDFFETERVHFDVSGDNIILYENISDLKDKLYSRLQAVLTKEKYI